MSAPEQESRTAGLRRIKLRALVSGRWGPDGSLDALEEGALPGGATLLDAERGRAWTLVDDGDPGRLGGAMAWSRRRGASTLHVLVEAHGGDGPGIIARRAALFRDPPVVWDIQGRELRPAQPTVAPSDRNAATERDPLTAAEVEGFSTLIAAHGALPVVEHGILRAEVLGLEVARVVSDPAGGWRLAVGVGRHDREARQELQPGQSAEQALEDTVALVRLWRTVTDRRHPANTLARERLLRAATVAHPELAGAVSLVPVPPPLPVEDLRMASPAGAVGVDGAGDPVVAVCSTGVHVDLVPTAADIRLLHAPDARLVLVVPPADAYPLTVELAAALRQPAEIRTVPADWARLAT